MIAGLVLIAAGVAVGALAVLGLRGDRAATTRQAWLRLADGLRLGRTDRRLIRRVAQTTRTPSPAVLLVSQGCFDRAADQFARRHGRRRQLAAIRRKVFAPADPGRSTRPCRPAARGPGRAAEGRRKKKEPVAGDSE